MHSTRFGSSFRTSFSAKLPRLLLVGLLVPMAAACGDDGSAAGREDPAGSVTVFAASSLTDTFEEVGHEFMDEHPATSVTFNFAASPSLREQILAGAPADVFAAADEPTMADVADSDALADEPVVFAGNRLALVVPAGNPGSVAGLTDLEEADLLVGLCDEEVPCGRHANEVLGDADVDAAVDTYEPNVRSLLTKVEDGELDAGLVYRTDALSAGTRVEDVPLPDGQNATVTYPIAALTEAGNPQAAQAFVDFLLSEAGQAILRSHGFDPA